MEYCIYIPVNVRGTKIINTSMPGHELMQKVVQHLVVEQPKLKLCTPCSYEDHLQLSIFLCNDVLEYCLDVMCLKGVDFRLHKLYHLFAKKPFSIPHRLFTQASEC